ARGRSRYLPYPRAGQGNAALARYEDREAPRVFRRGRDPAAEAAPGNPDALVRAGSVFHPCLRHHALRNDRSLGLGVVLRPAARQPVLGSLLRGDRHPADVRSQLSGLDRRKGRPGLGPALRPPPLRMRWAISRKFWTTFGYFPPQGRSTSLPA